MVYIKQMKEKELDKVWKKIKKLSGKSNEIVYPLDKLLDQVELFTGGKRMSNTKLERNLQILTDYRSEIRVRAIAKRYGLSRQRVYRILKWFEDKEAE